MAGQPGPERLQILFEELGAENIEIPGSVHHQPSHDIITALAMTKSVIGPQMESP